MHVIVSDSLGEFIQEQVRSGSYENADAFIEELIRAEVQVLDRVNRGDPLPVDEHFGRRLGVLLDEAESSGDYIAVSRDDFDAMEREGLELTRKSEPS